MQTEVTVLGGLPITVEFRKCGAEPDVGIMSDYIDEWYIVEIAGRPLRKKEKCDWLYARIEKAKEEDKICEACYNAAEGYREQAEIDRWESSRDWD